MSTLEFRGKHLDFLHDRTPARDLEGSLASGKTTVCLYDEIQQLRMYPGMHALISRWTDDATNLLLRPALEQMARIENFRIHWTDEKKRYYECENGSRIYCFGLKTQSQEPEQRYGKIRGLPVSRIYIDQAEQMPGDVAAELLLRLRPGLEQRAAGQNFPRQLTFSPNPPNTDSWLAKQFPSDNKTPWRKYYSLSIYDNAHNLPDDFITNALITYPPEHPKHQTVILGQRGPNIIGDPIYENLFDRTLHVRDFEPLEDAVWIEAFEFGRHNPTWVLGERTFHGALRLVGGVMGQRLMLEDFLPVVKRYRAEWTDDARKIATCCSATGETRLDTTRYSLVRLLRDAGFTPVWQETSNSHDVQLAMIESVSTALRRRTTAKEEALQINRDESRWLLAFPDGTQLRRPFVAFAFEGGYVWDPHVASTGNKDLRQPRQDDEYANAMRCVENLFLNFLAGQRTDDERQRLRREATGAASSADSDPVSSYSWMRV